MNTSPVPTTYASPYTSGYYDDRTSFSRTRLDDEFTQNNTTEDARIHESYKSKDEVLKDFESYSWDKYKIDTKVKVSTQFLIFSSVAGNIGIGTGGVGLLVGLTCYAAYHTIDSLLDYGHDVQEYKKKAAINEFMGMEAVEASIEAVKAVAPELINKK